MKRFALSVLVVLAFTSFAFAGTRTYQVTGPILEVKDDSITVQKSGEKWEIARDKDTKVTGDPKVGSKVTIQYTMKATTVEVKGSDAKKDEKKKK
ncbi:MAG TPA: hypothetical protein DCZ69_03045 [Syntrophobacteraceae bacterium]|nr:hypothetical protein [Syntrophobacteraceae bacterium]